ncbi:helix-turn-helix domain-containing protein [Flavivirga aquimarina]|uniref:Helix-turn-helix domain-containing protein n=1 Tax=Flavivirga aquimarina TaxID=2027862 RepID=A0ABT8WGD3_9FLAO|nr:helix-turn-helix domain-containing protein [Flavivirga aquimarina]MDO5972057.1 helix-turn-helix domain-containing protein [Flavivirga aquimarina]
MLNIKKEREKLNMTQKELAKLLGVTRKTIVNYEGGSNIPKSKEKLFTNLLRNYTQPKIEHEVSNPPRPDYKKMGQKELDFVTDAFKNRFGELMEYDPFRKEFVFRANEWIDNIRK